MDRNIQKSTLQVPLGVGSVITSLGLGQIKPFPAMVVLTLNYRSNWDEGRTWWTSDRILSDNIGMSHRYVRDALKQLLGTWVFRVKQGEKGSIYQLTHHLREPNDIPTDKYGNPLKFAVPRGEDAPFEKMFRGEILWKGCLIWLLLKAKSDFKTGITQPVTMEIVSSWSSFSKQTVCEMIKELENNELLQRLSRPHERSVFQLYPKPAPKSPVYRPKRRKKKRTSHMDMRCDEHYCYSFNEKYRMDLRTTEIHIRERHGRGRWKPLKDKDRHNMPKAIIKDFDNMVDEIYKIRKNLEKSLIPDGSDTAQASSDNTHRSLNNAQTQFSSDHQPRL